MPPQENQSASSLPPGYTLDATQTSTAASLPPGYTLDTSSSASSASTAKPAFSPGSYQLYKGGPVLDPNKSPMRTGVESFEGSMGVHNPTSLGNMFSQVGSGLADQAKASFNDWSKGLGGGGPIGTVLTAPLAAAMTPVDMAARGIESMASGIEQGSKDIAAGTQGNKWDWRSIASGIGTLAGTKAQLEIPEHVQRAFKTAASLIERQPTVEQGKIAYVNQARNAAHVLDNAVRTRGVGARVQPVIEADKLDLARTGSPGKVDTTQMTLDAQKQFEKVKLGGAPDVYGPMTMDDAKATLTQLGREASKLERTGKAPEASVKWTEYDGLRDATQKRAEELGMGRQWSDYSKEFRNYMQLQTGLLGHLMEGEHTAALSKIIQHSGQLPELQKWFSKYNVDMSPIRDAAEEGKKLQELTQQSSNALMGKIKLLSRHWAMGLPALAGIDAAVHGAGIPGFIGGFVLPLIIAGKVGSLLDTMQVKSLLHDLKSKLPPEQFQVAPDSVGPLEKLHTAASSGPVAAQPAAQPADLSSGPQDYTGPERRAAQNRVINDAVIDQLYDELRKATEPEDKARIQRNIDDLLEQRQQTPAAQAEKVKAARSVYRGRRGGTR